MEEQEKPLRFVGRAYDELRAFPAGARRLAGYNLGLVQQEREPGDWKPLSSVGSGVRELRIQTHDSGAVQHRVIYLARFADVVYVLHAFRKTTQATSAHNLEVARSRYAQVRRLHEQNPGFPEKGSSW